MGLFDKIKGEFIDIIEWTDSSNDTIVWRFPRYQNEIKTGAKLTVRESQVAVFVNEGQIADAFAPGMYELNVQNLPILTTLKGWKYGFNSPFKAEVYFISMRQFTNLKWGTKNPIMIRDAEFGPLRIRAFGNYAMRVKDPKVFLKEIAGTDHEYTTEEVNEQLRNIVVTRFSDAVASSKIQVLDMASNYDEFSKLIQDKVQPEFNEIGIDLTKLLIENISLPEEVEKVLDKRTSMGIVGNLGAYAQFQAANAMEQAAQNPAGGIAGAGVGMGMGWAMGNQMGNLFQQNYFNPQQGNSNSQTSVAPPVPTPLVEQYFIAINGQQNGPHTLQAFVQLIQSGQIRPDTLVWKSGMANWIQANQIPELQALFTIPPPVPPTV